MRSLLNSWQYRKRPIDCCISGDLISGGVFLRIQERTVPSTGSFICSAIHRDLLSLQLRQVSGLILWYPDEEHQKWLGIS